MIGRVPLSDAACRGRRRRRQVRPPSVFARRRSIVGEPTVREFEPLRLSSHGLELGHSDGGAKTASTRSPSCRPWRDRIRSCRGRFPQLPLKSVPDPFIRSAQFSDTTRADRQDAEEPSSSARVSVVYCRRDSCSSSFPLGLSAGTNRCTRSPAKTSPV